MEVLLNTNDAKNTNLHKRRQLRECLHPPEKQRDLMAELRRLGGELKVSYRCN
jgi:hypothetical protein